MDAYNRRLNIFKSELIDDIKMFNDLIESKDFIAIKGFAHKYKMRLTYFKYDKALNLCNEIERSQKMEVKKDILPFANELQIVLKKILIELKDEGISS